MQLRLRTKVTLTTAFLVLAVVGVNSTLYVMTLTRQVIRQADDRSRAASRQILFQPQNAVAGAGKAGEAPVSNSSEDLREYVRKALAEDNAVTSAIDAE